MKDFFYTVKAIAVIVLMFAGWFLFKSWTKGEKPKVTIKDLKAKWRKADNDKNEKPFISDNDIDSELNKLGKS